MRDFNDDLEHIRNDIKNVQKEFSRRIVGNITTLHFMIKAIISGGHVLLEGVPGLGKTLMVKTLSEVLDLDFRRVQFTPDLMPADIVGTNVIVESETGDRHFRFEKGPVFTQILLADEINRASPKTQSALLQAMEEREVTIFGATHHLDDVFFTLATQNPIEMAGTYPLPEAQLDRFMFKLNLDYPDRKSLGEIARLNVGDELTLPAVDKVLGQERIRDIRRILREIPITDRIYEFTSELIEHTHPWAKSTTKKIKEYSAYGSSPRGLNTLLSAARISAVLNGRVNLALEDLKENLLPSLRHRIVLRFEGEVEGISPDQILRELFDDLSRRYRE
jgi:MoxR-like ATPase